MTLIRDISQGHLEAVVLQSRPNAFVGNEGSDLSPRPLQALENGLTSGSVCSYNDDWHDTNLHDAESFPIGTGLVQSHYRDSVNS